MPDRAAVERIAKILARASMTDSKPEAEASIRGAHARMLRDGVSLRDLLNLPDNALYQKGLIALAEHMVVESRDLSEPAKRDLYARYLSQIVQRFSGEHSAEDHGQRRRQEQGSASADRPDQSSDAHANGSGEPSGFNAAAVFTKSGLVATAKGMLVITANSFRRGGFVWHAARDPLKALRLFAAAGLFGLGGGIAILLIAASLHSFLGLGGPWIDMKLQTAWALIGSTLFLYKSISLYRAGWF